jgi:lactate dehydrogenase-like 2-hydroxyacid dehydrogenase
MKPSSTPIVLVTRKIPETGLQLLQKTCDMDLFQEDRSIPREILLQKIKKIDGLLCLLSETIDEELLECATGLKVVSNYAVGYDNIDVSAATRHGVVVTNTPGVLTDATADLTWALLLASARRLAESDRIMRREVYPGWSPMYLLGNDITGKTLGLLGAGRIGTAVAERSSGWKMRILYYDQKRNSYLDKEFSAEKVGLDYLLSESDFISIHLPMSEQTHHLINGSRFQKMKRTAILINTARGPIIDEADLVVALKEKRIAGAGLDVYENEPDMAPGLNDLDNVTLAPHIGSATVHTRNEMARIAAQNLLAVLNGNRPEFVVNPEVYNDGS